MHWKLDVALKEDQSRVHAGFAAQNLSSLRKIALFYLESETASLASIENKQWKAALSTDYLQKVINL